MAIDPVCGMDVKEGESYTAYGEKIFHFCSEVCLKEFIKAPDKYFDELQGKRARRVYELSRLLAKTFYRAGKRGEFLQDLTQGEILAVETLGHLGRCKMSELARECGFGLTTVTAIMDRLVAKGYAKRKRGKGDRRSVYAELSGKGAWAYSQLIASNMEVVLSALYALAPEEQGVFASFCERILEHFDPTKVRLRAKVLEGGQDVASL